MSSNQFCRRTRREFLWEAGAGFGSLALTAMLGKDNFFGNKASAAESAFTNPMAPRQPHFPAKAKSRDLPVHVRRAEPGRYLRL